MLIYIVVLSVYIVILLGIGWGIHKRGFKNMREWALEKDVYSPFILSLTFFATTMSAFAFVGIPGFFYTHGIGTMLMIFLPEVCVAPFILYFVGKKIMALNKKKIVLTPLELIKHQLQKATKKDPNITRFISILFLFFIVCNIPYIVIQIAGVGKILTALTNNAVSYPIAAFVVILVIFIYAEWGGLKGIIWTDVFQGVMGLICLGGLAYAFVYVQWGGLIPFLKVTKTTIPSHLSLPGPTNKMTMGYLITNFVVLSGISISYIQLFSRKLLFHSTSQIKKTAFGFGAASLTIGLITAILGLGGAMIFANVPGDLIIVKIINSFSLGTLGGTYLGAIFFIVILTGAMSTADSVLFSLGTIFGRDICKNIINPKLTEKKERTLIKSFILLFLIVSYTLSMNPPQFIIDLALLGLSAAAIVVPSMIYIIYSKRPNATISLTSLISGICIFTITSFMYNPTSLGAGFWGYLTAFIFIIVPIGLLKANKQYTILKRYYKIQHIRSMSY